MRGPLVDCGIITIGRQKHRYSTYPAEAPVWVLLQEVPNVLGTYCEFPGSLDLGADIDTNM